MPASKLSLKRASKRREVTISLIDKMIEQINQETKDLKEQMKEKSELLSSIRKEYSEKQQKLNDDFKTEVSKIAFEVSFLNRKIKAAIDSYTEEASLALKVKADHIKQIIKDNEDESDESNTGTTE